jgi:hypothetical protein
MQKLLLALSLSLLTAACGTGGSSMTTAEVQSFRTAVQAVSSAAASYGAQATTLPDLPACTAAEASYHGQVAPMVERMAAMGAGMDDHMASMGHMGDGDMGCGAAAMAAELARHHGVACASTVDMTPNEAEAGQHAAAMAAWADHMKARADQMGSYMGMGMMGGGGTAVSGLCVRQPDGSYVLRP